MQNCWFSIIGLSYQCGTITITKTSKPSFSLYLTFLYNNNNYVMYLQIYRVFEFHFSMGIHFASASKYNALPKWPKS